MSLRSGPGSARNHSPARERSGPPHPRGGRSGRAAQGPGAEVRGRSASFVRGALTIADLVFVLEQLEADAAIDGIDYEGGVDEDGSEYRGARSGPSPPGAARLWGGDRGARAVEPGGRSRARWDPCCASSQASSRSRPQVEVLGSLARTRGSDTVARSARGPHKSCGGGAGPRPGAPPPVTRWRQLALQPASGSDRLRSRLRRPTSTA